MTALYFPSFCEHKMVTVQPSVTTEWCDESYLELNLNQTKEMIVDIRRRRHTDRAIEIHDEKVEIVHSYKYLGTIFEDTLKWDLNTEVITKKRHQRLRLLQKLKSFDVIQLFLCCFITILLRTFRLFLSFAGFII